MVLSKRLYKASEEIWNSYYEHPFVKGIGDGTLEISKFRFYMIQDYLYLIEYSKVFALGVMKACDEESMRLFSSLVYNTLNGEMKIHKTYMKRLGINEDEIKSSKPSLANISYTNYMLCAGNGGVIDVAASVLSCSWSYALIGQRLNKIDGASEHELYGEWIKGYSSDEYIKENQKIIEFLNRVGEDISEIYIKKLTEIFINCSRYEYMFWDMAYNKEM